MNEFLINEVKDRWIEEGEMKSAAEMLRMLIAKRFPKLKVAQKIRRIRDVALLQQLCVKSLDVKGAAEMRKCLDEAIKSQRQ